MSWQSSTAARRQAPLRRAYAEDPAQAVSTKRVVSVPSPGSDIWHGRIITPDFPQTSWDYGLDAKVGGDDDRPNPGHLLCGALAACVESTTRVVADHLSVPLEELTVEVVGDVDTRGCLAMDRRVRPGFRRIEIEIRLRPAPGTDAERIGLLLDQAEALCVTLDTVRHGVQVDVTTAVDSALPAPDHAVPAGVGEASTADR